MSKNYKILMLASACNGVSFSMILPLLAPLTRQLKLTEFQAGLLVSAGALMMCLGALWISKRSQQQNIYKLLSWGFVGMTLTWGLFSAVLSYALYFPLSLGVLVLLLIASRASTGIFMAMPQIALQSYVMTYFTHEQQRSQTMATFGALNSAGLILGPLLTTLLIAQGLLVPLWLAIILLTGVSLIIIFNFNREALKPAFSETNEYVVQSQRKALIFSTDQLEHDLQNNLEKDLENDLEKDLTNRLENRLDDHLDNPPTSFQYNFQTIFWLSVGFSLFLAIVTLNLTAGFYIQDQFHLSIQQSAIYFAQCSLIAGVALVCMQLAISKRLKWSLNQLFIIGVSTMLMGLFICIFSSDILLFQAAYLFFGVAIACLSPAFTTGAAQSVSLKWQTKLAALCTVVQSLSLVIAPLVSTAIYQWDIVYPFYFLMGLFVSQWVYYLFLNVDTTTKVRIS